MQTLLVVRMKGMVPFECREKYREKIMKDIQEGLVIVDDNVEIIAHTITGEVGLEFNLEGDK